MKTSEILTLAKKQLARNKAEADKPKYVCAVLNPFKKHPEIRKLMHRISESLTPEITVVRWLYHHGHTTSDQAYNIDLMQAYRHRWLDSLVQEYKEKGD